MAETSIEWTDKTWNPTRGCSRVSEGCRHCYAETLAGRYSAFGANPDSPFAGFVTKVNGHASWTGKVELVDSMLDLPLHWKKPCRIFVNSMSDLFHEALPDEAIDRVFAVMALCPQHTFQILTKRPERMRTYISYLHGPSGINRRDLVAQPMPTYHGMETPWPEWPLPNVWLGTSVEDQATADERIPLLLRTPAAIRFVSYEPALGPVDFTRIPLPPKASGEEWDPIIHMNVLQRASVFAPHVHWIIVGGESGPGARPFDIQWARNTIAQCKAAGVACFVKQLGAQPIIAAARQHHYDFGEEIGRKARFSAVDPMQPSSGMWRVHFQDRKGGSMEEWAEDLRVREFPVVQTSDKVIL